MPYPALPPESPLPPVVSVASTEAARRPSLLESTSAAGTSDSTPVEPAIASKKARVSAPESFPPQAAKALPPREPTRKTAIAPPTAQKSLSCAELLNFTVLPTEQSSKDSSHEKACAGLSESTVLPTAPSVAAARPPQSRDVAPANRSTPIKQSAKQAVKLSGTSGQLAKLPEATVMQQLNQAIAFEALVESYQALSTLSADDLRRFANHDRGDEVSQTPSNTTETFPVPSDILSPRDQAPLVTPLPVGTPTPPTITPATAPSPRPGNGTLPVPTADNVIEVTADRQEYDERRQIFTAEGKVMMRFRNGLLEGDRVQVNLTNRLTVAEGNVALTRGTQVLRGQRFEYNFVQGVGTVERARGDIYLPDAGRDTALTPETVSGDRTTLTRPLSDRITSQKPLANVTSPGGINFSFGAGRDINRLPGALPSGGVLKRLRFEAQRIDFTPEGWEAQNIDITNDPFSPPELVLRANRAVLTRVSPLEDEVLLTRPRLVFDQKVSVPFLRRRFVLSRAEQEPSYFRFGFDNQDRGGLFVEGILNIINTGKVNLTVYPQIFLQRMFTGASGLSTTGTTATGTQSITDPSNFGIRSSLDVFFSNRTTLRARAALTSLDPEQFENQLRASIRLEQLVLPTRFGFHRIGLEYSYRDRLFNGSLGFQTVQTSLGAVFQSPNITLGDTGLVVNYQVGYQLVTADTDRLDLLAPIRENNRVQLGRFQATAGIGRSFALWTGKALPATRNEGLNYTPSPVTPQISISTSLRGVLSQYTSGDAQQDLIGSVGLFAQFGHFSRPFFDYTAISIAYSQFIGGGQSPFLFDRTVDNRVLSLSFFQQLYGPLRAGVQTAINLDTRKAISTDLFLEYSRRTHGIIVRYNPVLEIGSIGFRISDFNWTGTAEPFEGAGVVPVEGGIERR